METAPKPDSSLARRVLPPPLFKALVHIFSQNINDCMLVGGTALSGFYAGHRRSDDIDLFVKNESAFSQAVLACKSLTHLGAVINESAHSKQYYKAVCLLDKHSFTVDIVIDGNLFEQGRALSCSRHIYVADLASIFMMKSATLVSRCSEKDLYDLLWLSRNLEGVGFSDMLVQGAKIDTGVTPEAVLYSVSSCELRKEACDFSLDQGLDASKVYSRISQFRKGLVRGLYALADKKTDSNLKTLVEKIRGFEVKE